MRGQDFGWQFGGGEPVGFKDFQWVELEVAASELCWIGDFDSELVAAGQLHQWADGDR